ncbi:MAG: HEAT repeat domain-containing protein [Nitrospirae bacterium]|nr:HEAT repeat domain-containing protein [Nitrospirota bacterium]
MGLDVLADRFLQDKVLLYLGISVLVLLGLTLLFAGFTVMMRLRNNIKARRWARLEREWEPWVMEAVGRGRHTAFLAEWIRPWDRDYFLEFLLRYANRFRGEERRTLSSLAHPFLARIARRRRSKDPEDRARAVQMLSSLGLPEYADEVLKFLDDPSPLVAMIAARALAQKEFVGHATAIMDHLHRFEDWSPGFLAAMLAAVGPELAPQLEGFLSDPEKQTSARSVAAEALLRLNQFSAAERAAAIIETEQSVDLVAACLRLLGAVGRPEHLDLIRRQAKSSHFSIRAQAIGALGRLGDMEDVAVLRRAFMDKSPWVAIQAATALKGIGADGILEAIAEAPSHPRHILAQQILESAA